MTPSSIKKEIYGDLFLYFTIGFIFALAAIVFTSYYSYRVIEENSSKQAASVVRSVMTSKEDQITQLTLNYALWNKAYDNLARIPNEEWAYENISLDAMHGFKTNFVAVLNSDGSPLFLFKDGEKLVSVNRTPYLDVFKPLVKAFPRRASLRDSATHYIKINKMIHLVSIAVIQPVHPVQNIPAKDRVYLVMGRSLDKEIIRSFQKRFDIEGLSLVNTLPTEDKKNRPHVTLTSIDTPSSYLIWGVDDDVQQILNALIPLGLAEIFILCLVGFIIARHVIRAARSYETLVSQLLATTDQLTKAKSFAESSDKNKSKLLSAMSHEIRTPMNGVMGMISLLKETTLDQTQVSYVNTIQKSSEALMMLVDNILEFSELELKKINLNKKAVPIRKLLDDIHGLLMPIALEKDIQFSVIIAPDVPPFIQVDPVRIRQILLHLTTNSLKFTKVGSVQIKVTSFPIKEDKTEIAFHITDTGIGISDSMKEHLFDDFYQGAPSQDGTGLGLSIVRKLVVLMGGKIGLDSKLAHGSTFWFSLQAPKLLEIDSGAPKPEEPATTKTENAQQQATPTGANGPPQPPSKNKDTVASAPLPQQTSTGSTATPPQAPSEQKIQPTVAKITGPSSNSQEEPIKDSPPVEHLVVKYNEKGDPTISNEDAPPEEPIAHLKPKSDSS